MKCTSALFVNAILIGLLIAACNQLDAEQHQDQSEEEINQVKQENQKLLLKKRAEPQTTARLILQEGNENLDDLISDIRDNLVDVLNVMIPEKSLASYGFTSRDDLLHTKILERLRSAEIDDTQEAVVALDAYYLPVMNVRNEISLFIAIMKHEEKWRLLSVGAPYDAAIYHKFSKHPSMKEKLDKSTERFFLKDQFSGKKLVGLRHKIIDPTNNKEEEVVEFFLDENQTGLGEPNPKKPLKIKNVMKKDVWLKLRETM